MGSKSILLLGTLVGSAIAYFCIQNNKELFTPKEPKAAIKSEHVKVAAQKTQTKDIEQAIVSQTKHESAKEEKIIQKEPSYLYENGENPRLVINANSADETKEIAAIADKYCNVEGCVREISFERDIKKAPWLKQAEKITAFLASNSIPKGSISIHDKVVTISGEFNDEAKSAKFHSLVKSLEAYGFKITDHTSLIKPKEQPKPKIEIEEIKPEKIEVKIPEQEIEQEEIVQPEITEVKEPSSAVEIEQNQQKINDILNTNPIYFKRNSNEISLQSKKILDKIIDIVNKNTQSLSLKISGHTDASGKASYNKWLSQQRANAVKEYLIKNNIQAKSINAIGYGEERPFTADPYDKRNRRVTIEIKKGE